MSAWSKNVVELVCTGSF